MSAYEKNDINQRLAAVANSFGLKFKLTINNAQKMIEDNYKKIRKIDTRIQKRVASLHEVTV